MSVCINISSFLLSLTSLSAITHIRIILFSQQSFVKDNNLIYNVDYNKSIFVFHVEKHVSEWPLFLCLLIHCDRENHQLVPLLRLPRLPHEFQAQLDFLLRLKLDEVLWAIDLYFLLFVEASPEYSSSVEDLQLLWVARMELEVSRLGQSVLEHHTLLALSLVLGDRDVIDLAYFELFVLLSVRLVW